MFPIPDRMAFSEISGPLFEALNIGGYGEHYENDVFYMHPYCWCDSDACPQCGEPRAQFNLYHKASGFGLTWYKYHLRSAETNQEVTLERYQEIINECIVSVSEPIYPRSKRINDPRISVEMMVAKGNLNTYFGKHHSPRTILYDPTLQTDLTNACRDNLQKRIVLKKAAQGSKNE